MEPLTDVDWDVVIGGTGLAESLFALSLSRSNKKILHVDSNGYYGGPDAALTLQEVDEWAVKVQRGSLPYFYDAVVTVTPESDEHDSLKLGSSRSYNIALGPQLIYARSTLIPTLVSSKVYRQLEFLAVGGWYIYSVTHEASGETNRSVPLLRKIPTRREDIFEDRSLDLRSKRALIKFLRLVLDAEARAAALADHGDTNLGSYLTDEFHIPPPLQAGVHALTMSPWPLDYTLLSYALPRIERHLNSFGVFGAGFNALVPKWGGNAEIVQVACRSLAVGGGVYMLGHGIRQPQGANAGGGSPPKVLLDLENGDTVRTTWYVDPNADAHSQSLTVVTRSVTIVASELAAVFPLPGEGVPKPAAAVVVFPGGSLESTDATNTPVYLVVHSSDTGECPPGQSVIYASIALEGELAANLLDQAVRRFLVSLGESSETCIRWVVRYMQRGLVLREDRAAEHRHWDATATTGSAPTSDSRVRARLSLAPPSVDLTVDGDQLLASVRAAWSRVTGAAHGFMDFDDRENSGAYDSESEA